MKIFIFLLKQVDKIQISLRSQIKNLDDIVWILKREQLCHFIFIINVNVFLFVER